MTDMPGGVGASADGRVLVFPGTDNGARELIVPTGQQFSLAPQENVRHCAVSPDGRWVATGSHGASQSPGAKIWDARTGRHVCDLPVPGFCYVSFSPDGKWLLTSGGRARLWSVGNWTEGARLANSTSTGAFSSDGTLLALQDEPGIIQLVAPDTGKEYSRLTSPDAIPLFPLCFTADSRRLVCRSSESESIFVFDLGLIRTQLAAIGLDWDAPSLPVEPHLTPNPVVVRIASDVAGPTAAVNEITNRTLLPASFAKWAYPADEQGLPGYFQRQGSDWVETKNGKVQAHFTMTTATSDYLVLYDPSRKMWLRLSQTDVSWSVDKTNWYFIFHGAPVSEGSPATEANPLPLPATDRSKPESLGPVATPDRPAKKQ